MLPVPEDHADAALPVSCGLARALSRLSTLSSALTWRATAQDAQYGGSVNKMQS